MVANSPQVVDCLRLNITILLVDNDATALSVNAGFLRSWQYKVATATSGHEALKTLKEFRGFFDLVITDLNIRGMNGIELQKRVKREFHLPVIFMSEDKRKNVMSRNLEHGVAYCMAKPIRREDLKDVWQYAVTGRREKLRVENDRIVSVSKEAVEGDSPPPPTVNSASPQEQRKKYCKRKHDEVIENEELIFCGPKRSKIFWTTNLHNRFLLAIDYIGMDKAVPTKILEIMNVPGLTRENVASHLQKYRMFLKKIEEKGVLEGLSERALRSRFAMGLPTDLIRDLKRRVSHFRRHENYCQQHYGTVVSRPLTTRPLPTNQTRLTQPNHYGTNHTYRNFQQNQANHHNRPSANGGFMTSANTLTANGLMSNYTSLRNSRNFNYVPVNYDNKNNHGMIMTYGSSELQRTHWTYNHHHGSLLNNNYNNHGIIMPYGGSGLHQSPSIYSSHCGIQLNNNSSLTFGASNRVPNVGYTGQNNNYNHNNIFGLSNGSASDYAFVPISSSLVNVCVEQNQPNMSAGFPSFPQKSINGIRNAGGGNHKQHNIVTSANQLEAGRMDDLDELFLMLNDMVLPEDEVFSNQIGERPQVGVRSTSDILSSFNIKGCIELLQGDGDHVTAQTNERSLNVLLNKSSSCTKENPNLVVRNDASTNLEPIGMFMADQQANSSARNSTPLEQDLDMDLIEMLLFDVVDPN